MQLMCLVFFEAPAEKAIIAFIPWFSHSISLNHCRRYALTCIVHFHDMKFTCWTVAPFHQHPAAVHTNEASKMLTRNKVQTIL